MKYIISLSLIILFALVTRVYAIAWGAPFFFHPDERNIASAVTQLHLLHNMNPHFFAYGSLPIYSTYFLGVLANLLHITHAIDPFTVLFDQAIIIGRFYSAIFSLLTIYVLFIMGRMIHSKIAGVITAFFATTSIGLMQYAHFATFEMWLTFFSLLLGYLCIRYVHSPTKKLLFFLGLVLGILLSSKVSSLFLFLPTGLVVLVQIFFTTKDRWYKKAYQYIFRMLFLSVLACVIFVLTNPFVLLDTSAFIGSIQYETNVATGVIPVFYTQGFLHTVPILYQCLFVFPFLLNIFFAIFAAAILVCTIYLAYKNKQYSLGILYIFLGVLFFSQAVLFVKWTRYMIPTLPYIYLITIIGFFSLIQKIHTSAIKKILITLLTLVCFFSFFIACYFFWFIYIQEDSRVVAYQWAKRNIPQSSTILSEVYDLGIVPFNESFNHITLFNFYEMENDPSLPSQLPTQIDQSTYIILPSQRIFKNRVTNPTLFPKSASFYLQLADRKKYEKIYETPCDIFCRVLYNFNPIFNTEETSTVFDHPIVTIYKKL